MQPTETPIKHIVYKNDTKNQFKVTQKQASKCTTTSRSMHYQGSFVKIQFGHLAGTNMIFWKKRERKRERRQVKRKQMNCRELKRKDQKQNEAEAKSKMEMVTEKNGE